MPLNSISEDEMLLAEAGKDNSLQISQSRKKMGRKMRRKSSSVRMVILAVLSSSIISVVATAVTHRIIFAHFEHPTEEAKSFLPGLDVPVLGTNQAVFMPEHIYRQRPSNASYEAWMKLFPSSYPISLNKRNKWSNFESTEGKGYVSLSRMREAGPIPDFIEHENADGTGRFCIAAFHQMHCLYLLQLDLWAALDGTINTPGPHTLHCLDYLRTSIICAADTTLEPFKSRFNGFSGGNAVDGFGSNHQCRSFENLYHWAERMRYNDDTDAENFEG